MLDKGEIVAYFGDRAILSYLASKSSDPSKLRLADNYFSLEPYALALPHGDEDFRLAVDRALSHIYRSGEIAHRVRSYVRRPDAAERHIEDPLFGFGFARLKRRPWGQKEAT